jgi:hypothetical protein
MLDYSGKADDDLLVEIESRGGLEKLKRKIGERNLVPDEIKRINKLVFNIYKSEPDHNKIRNSITSNVLSPEELSQAIDAALKNTQSYFKDTAINSRTIIGSIIGVIISGVLGAALWCFSIVKTGRMIYLLLGVIYIIAYLIIRLLTNQSKNNVLVFIASFVAALIAIPLGLWFYHLTKG